MPRTQNNQSHGLAAMTRLVSGAPCIGQLAGTNQQGDVLVKFDSGNPRPAKLVAGLDKNELITEKYLGREVLLIFEKGNPACPIVVNLMADPLEGILSLAIPGDGRQEARDVLVDGKRVTIEAEEEVILKCGRGSITLRKDGKIVIKGTHLLSRSSGPHRIKGGRVDIN